MSVWRVQLKGNPMKENMKKYTYTPTGEKVLAVKLYRSVYERYTAGNPVKEDREGYFVERIEENSLPNHKNHKHPVEWLNLEFFESNFELTT